MTVIKSSPTNTQGITELDVRVSPKLGRELAEDIRESVDWTQRFIQMTLPDRLIVTQKQFVSLQDFTEEMYHTTDRMFVTPLNIMEVAIDRDVDTVPEIEDTIQAAEELEAEGHDHKDNPDG